MTKIIYSTKMNEITGVSNRIELNWEERSFTKKEMKGEIRDRVDVYMKKEELKAFASLLIGNGYKYIKNKE